MQMKKLLSTGLALALLTTSAIGVMAEDTPAEEATNPIIGNAIVGAATQDVKADFTYVANENASATVTVDVDENAKKEVYNKNFNDLAVDSTVVSENTGANYYGGTKGVTATVKKRAEGDNCISIGQWRGNVFNVYDGTSYDATFWMRATNNQYSKYDIRIKADVFLSIRSTSAGGDGLNYAGLYIGYSDPGAASYNNLLGNGYGRLAYVDLNKYGVSSVAGMYWRIVSTYSNVRVYVNTVNDFTNVKPIIDVNLGGDKVGERSLLGFTQGNTGLLIDDVVVNEIGNEPKNDGDEAGGALVKDVDFEGDFTTREVPANATLINDSYRGWCLSLGSSATLLENIRGDYTAQFYVRGINQYDRMTFRIRDNYSLTLRGYAGHMIYNEDGTQPSHVAAIINSTSCWYGPESDSNNSAITAENALVYSKHSNIATANGAYVKIQVANNVISVWISTSGAPEFTEEPTLTYTPEETLGSSNPLAFSNQHAGVKFDNFKVDCETFIYENDYGKYAYNGTNTNLVTNENTGNTLLTTGEASPNNVQFKTATLFETPENYEMTFWMSSSNNSYTDATVFIRNKIKIKLIGTGQGGVVDPRYVKLYNDKEELDSYKIKDIPTIGEAPFVSGYVRVIVNNGKIEVYASKYADYKDEALILETTINESTTDNTVRLYDGNTQTSWDNFKVYDLDKAGNANIGAGYKQVVLNGTDVKLVDVIDGVATEIGAYTLPVAGARYRISVAKANGKLTVYVNGKSAIEVDSNAAGLMFYQGTYEANTELGTAAPLVISAGDLDYNEGVDTADLVLMRKVLLGLDKTAYFTEAVNVDADTEMKIDIRDLIRMKKIMAKIA